MENQKKNHTITIKIDGKSRTYQENKKDVKQEEASSKSFVEDDGRMLDKKKKMETISIKQPDFQEVAAASAKKEEDDFDWVLPEPSEEPELEEYKIASYTSKPKNSKSVFQTLKKNKMNFSPSIFFALFMAVIVGMSFGFILLRLVISDQTLGSETPVTTVAPVEQSEQGSGKSYTLPTISTFVVQQSALSTVEAAAKEKEALDQKGIPSAIVTTDRSYVFVGIGETKDNGKAIGDRLTAKGIEIYPKEFQVGGTQLNDINSTEQQAMDLASQVYAPLVSISTSLTLEQDIPEAATEKVKQIQAEWEKMNNEEIENKTVIEMKEVIDKAFSVANDPSKEKSQELQQLLLGFLSLYTKEQ